jgi:hypothetical protein
MKVTEANLGRLAKAVEAAMHDEGLTRARVDQLEPAMGAALAVLGRGFWGRMAWLFLGR